MLNILLKGYYVTDICEHVFISDKILKCFLCYRNSKTTCFATNCASCPHRFPCLKVICNFYSLPFTFPFSCNLYILHTYIHIAGVTRDNWKRELIQTHFFACEKFSCVCSFRHFTLYNFHKIFQLIFLLLPKLVIISIRMALLVWRITLIVCRLQLILMFLFACIERCNVKY
jgi:hypothetical protein